VNNDPDAGGAPSPPRLPPEIALRPSEDSDREFSFELFKQITAPEFDSIGLPEEQLASLLRQQFEIRELQWRRSHPHADWSIITAGATPIGEWCVAEDVEAFHLINAALEESWRGRGIAAALVRSLFAEASRASKPVRAHVRKDNPAQPIWSHLGFEFSEDLGAYYSLIHSPGGSPAK
jgi:GNAT superfamily N-acetyltransferase